jgi:hypothetical protein
MYSPLALLALVCVCLIVMASLSPRASRHLPRLSALFALVTFCLLGTAVLAADASPPPPAVKASLFEQAFSYLGMAAAGLSAVAALLPRSWKVTQLAARFSADLRGILTPDTADDPSWSNPRRDNRP